MKGLGLAALVLLAADFTGYCNLCRLTTRYQLDERPLELEQLAAEPLQHLPQPPLAPAAALAPEPSPLTPAAPGAVVVDEPAANAYPLPRDAQGRDEVFIGRIRDDASHPNGLALWIVADNLRKGAATNAVQIAEALVTNGWL